MTDTQRYNTGNELGSNKLEDLSDNAKNIDLFSVSQDEYYQDRKGVQRKTVKKFENEHDVQISAHETEHDAQILSHESQFNQVISEFANSNGGSFSSGFTVQNRGQYFYYETGGQVTAYRWIGSPLNLVVTAGTAPQDYGVIGTDWVDVTDLSLRKEVVGLKTFFAQLGSSIDDIQSALNNLNVVNLSGEKISTTSPLEFDGFNRVISGRIDQSLCIGDRIRTDSGFVKSGHTTVPIVKSDSTTVDVDCILYTNYELRDFDDGDHYPSSSKIEDLTLTGDDTTTAGYCVGLAGGVNINRMTVKGCIDSFSFYDLFKSQISNINFDGQFRYRNGTSISLTNATAYPNADIATAFAFNIEHMLYSELHTCTGDNLTVPTFRFYDCHAVTLTACGCEKNNFNGHGKFIYSEGYNDLTIIGANIVNNSTDTTANFRFTEGDNITIIGGRSNLDVGSRTNPDIHIAGNDCRVEVFGHTFRDQNNPSYDSIPSVSFAPGLTRASVIVHLKNGRTVIIAPTGTFDSKPKTFTPTISINGTTFDFTVDSATGTYSVNGEMVTVNGRIKLRANSATSGSVVIGGLPISCSSSEYAAVTLYTEYALNGMTARLTGGTNIFPLKETTSPTLNRENVVYTDLSAVSEIIFSVTYKGTHLVNFTN